MCNAFRTAYATCALWSSVGDDDRPMDEAFTVADFAPEAMERIRADCDTFQARAGDLLADIRTEQAGHDFWLTRNRHGAGFWDRGLGDVGDRLTALAHTFGECNVYVGDDGLIYLS